MGNMETERELEELGQLITRGFQQKAPLTDKQKRIILTRLRKWVVLQRIKEGTGDGGAAR